MFFIELSILGFYVNVYSNIHKIDTLTLNS